MSGVWVYKADGSVQCSPEPGITPETMRDELSAIIPSDAILKYGKAHLPLLIPALCGSPTGEVNVYEITDEGYYVLTHGFVGPRGFALWIWGDPDHANPPHEAELARSGDGEPFPVALLRNAKAEDAPGAFLNLIASLTQVGGQPTQIAELVGRPCRCYKQGDILTRDYRPDRVNVELTESHKIARIWFG